MVQYGKLLLRCIKDCQGVWTVVEGSPQLETTSLNFGPSSVQIQGLSLEWLIIYLITAYSITYISAVFTILQQGSKYRQRLSNFFYTELPCIVLSLWLWNLLNFVVRLDLCSAWVVQSRKFTKDYISYLEGLLEDSVKPYLTCTFHFNIGEVLCITNVQPLLATQTSIFHAYTSIILIQVIDTDHFLVTFSPDYGIRFPIKATSRFVYDHSKADLDGLFLTFWTPTLRSAYFSIQWRWICLERAKVDNFMMQCICSFWRSELILQEILNGLLLLLDIIWSVFTHYDENSLSIRLNMLHWRSVH